jgi:hypothetical protein
MNIFISYSRSDGQEVKQIIEDFESLGYKVWFDKELSGGQSWWDRILSEIRNCDLFVFVLSAKSNNSTACNREYTYAFDLNKRILPILVDDVSTNLLPPALTAIHFVDYRDKGRNSVLGLVKALNSLPEPSPPPDPLPPSPEVPISYLGNLKAEIETSQTLSFEDQSAILLKLKERLKNEAEEKDVYQLLRKFKQRDELYHRIAEQIDELLAGKSPERVSQPVQPGGNPQAQPSPPQPKQAQTAFQAPPSRSNPGPAQKEKSTDWVGVVGLIGAIFIPILGVGFGIWSLVRINNASNHLKGSVWGWLAIGLGLFMMLVYLVQFMSLSTYDPYGY